MSNPAALLDLKENYTKLGHPLFHSGITKIYKYYKGKDIRLSIKDIEDFLSTVYSYTVSKFTRKSKINPTFKHFKRYQFQVCTQSFE